MGDNRSDSTDSRMIGYVPLGDIVGRADLIFWPLKDITLINH
jgi:signal peptidase I